MNDIIKAEQSTIGELVDDDIVSVGDYVTRDGTDIHYVESGDEEMITVICIVAPSSDWTSPGEIESNLTRRYSRCNRHFLPFCKSEHNKLKQRIRNNK